MNNTTILNNLLSYSEETLHIGGLTIITLIIVIGTFFLACICIFCPLIIFGDNDRRYGRCDKDNLHLSGNGKRGLLSLMFAKLDEFDSLTPLILSPEGSNNNNNNSLATVITEHGIMMDESPLKNNNLLQKIVSSPAALRNILSRSCSGSSMTHKNSLSTPSSDDSKNIMGPEEIKQAMVAEFLTLHTSSNSPPPIKRTTYGETLIAPLTNSNKNIMLRIHPSNNVILTPESRVTTFDYTTSKSCATIPEDDEECESIYGDDLVSIDRTVMSNAYNHNNYSKYNNRYNLSMYSNIPKPYNGQTPPPSYPPPTPPDKRKMDIEKFIKPESPTKKSGISNLSTPVSSVGGSNSIVDDTCSSVSNGSLIENEEICEINPLEGNLDGNYLLHRIDEVSESLTTGSKTIDSIATMESYTISNFINPSTTGFKMARSVSEQFELGFNNKKIDN